MASLGRLGRLQSLELDGYSHVPSTCNLRMLLNVISECRSLVTLKIARLDDSIIEPPNKDRQSTSSHPSTQHQEIENVLYPPGTWKSILGRALRITSSSRTIPRPNRPSKDLSAKEPWRKFVPDTTIPFQSASDHILSRPLDTSTPYPHLRRLHLSIDTSPTPDHSQTGLEILFQKTPLLEDLSLNCTSIQPLHLAACLDAITDTCHGIQSLEFIHFRPSTKSYNNMDAIRRFFKQHRPNLTVLRLRSCMGLEFVLDLIPPATLEGLERVSFEYTLYSHPILHKFMTQCKALQYFTWTIEPPFTPNPPVPQPLPLSALNPTQPTSPNSDYQQKRQISAFLEPWACNKTMRHIEQTHAIHHQDQESFDFYYNHRLAQMERLVSLGVSFLDIRKSMLAAGVGQADAKEQEEERVLSREGREGLFHDISRGKVVSQIPYGYEVWRTFVVPQEEQGQPSFQEASSSTTAVGLAIAQSQGDDDQDENIDKDHLHTDNAPEEEKRGWHFKHVQELILNPIGINTYYLLDTRQLTLTETQYLLDAFPKLRKIRYRGRIFPLDYEARTFLEELRPRRIMVIHVSQGSTIM
ncbi:hypothetical protein K457DRAFT_141169 [Linnemannia elongata AG-77]|uniref:F-box domain-containing protein n=1 Tax=Linnemannia elongata AG-77 TaxID=1314771 RepID=A0A197JK66_9FUNG|nr:hypothetical protein K457DRAFT_141169 [Linnemannia elongata AG-77]